MVIKMVTEIVTKCLSQLLLNGYRMVTTIVTKWLANGYRTGSQHTAKIVTKWLPKLLQNYINSFNILNYI